MLELESQGVAAQTQILRVNSKEVGRENQKWQKYLQSAWGQGP